MSSKGLIIAGAIGGIAAVGISAYLLSTAGTVSPSGTVPPPPPTGQVLTSITLTGPTQLNAGQTGIYTATAYDQSDAPMSGVSLLLFDSETGATGAMGMTDSTGQVTADVSFPSPGTYNLSVSG